jgi:glycolate oxidase iron-sulfur subunit
LQHSSKSADAGPQVLRHLGFEVVEPRDQSCCGSAGVYSVLQPELSRTLQQQKIAALCSLNPNIIVSGNIGCAAQIGADERIPVLHPIELVHWVLSQTN